MLVERIVVAFILLPLAGIFIYLGGWPFALAVAVLAGISGWEFWRMVKNGGFAPSAMILIGGVALLPISHQWGGNQATDLAFSILILASMVIAVFFYEQGLDHPASNFGFNAAGLVYIGWLSTYLVALRGLPNGLWWVAICLPSAWMADTGAYIVGNIIGRHRLAPRVSPRKSWEGYLGGLPFAVAWGSAVAWFIQAQVPAITPLHGAILGLLIGLTAPLGDLFESILKRQFGIKDSSHILPGHGGIMDRIDTTLWTGIVSYYIIMLFFL